MKCSLHRIRNRSYHKMFEGINFKYKLLTMFPFSEVGMKKTKSHVRQGFVKPNTQAQEGNKGLENAYYSNEPWDLGLIMK